MDWLKEYLDVSLPVSELIDKLDAIGLMVDSREEKGGDIILNIETYVNRPDTLGHLGMARELAALLDLPLKEKNWLLIEIEEKTSDLVEVQIWDEDLCPRYCGIVVKGITVGPSPDWLRERIEAMGLKPINNIVDVTNYVLFSTSHPIHAFDLAKIAGSKIVVRKAKKGEELRTLEGKDAVLSPEMLVIADEEKPVALAGVIGGEGSAVSEETRDVFIESAYFDPVSVRKTRKENGLDTDASYRFERGADISFLPHAAVMAASLLCQFGGKASRGIVDVYPSPRKNREIILRHRRIGELLGIEIEEAFVEKILANLGFGIEPESRGVWLVRVPFFRVDIEREADLIEEVARFFGYEKIPSVLQPLKVIETPPDRTREKIQKLRQLFFHQGYDEVLNFSFSDPDKEAVYNLERMPIKIWNPVSSKSSLLRTSLLGGLLETTVWNKNRGIEGVHIFEIGDIYSWEDSAPCEKISLAFLTIGPLVEVHWQGARRDADFFHLKGTCEAMMTQLRYEPFSFERDDHPAFEPGFSLALAFKREKIGWLGQVKKKILDFYSIKQDVYAAEIDLALLLEKLPKPFHYVPVSKFPSISRDISFLAGIEIPYQDIQKSIEKLALPYLEEYSLVDLYSGPSIAKDKVSLSLRFIYRHPQRTLTAEEADKFDQRIISHLKSAFKIQLREGGFDRRTLNGKSKKNS